MSGLTIHPTPTDPAQPLQPWSPHPLAFHHIPSGLLGALKPDTTIQTVGARVSRLRYLVCSEQSLARMWAKFGAKALTRSMERESIAAAPRAVLRKERPPLVFANPEPSPWGEEDLTFKRNSLMVWPEVSSHSTCLPHHVILSSTRGEPIRSFPKRKKKELIPLVGRVCPEADLFHSTQHKPRDSWAISWTEIFTSMGLSGVLACGTGNGESSFPLSSVASTQSH